MLPAGDFAEATRVPNAVCIERSHACVTTRFIEVARVIIGEAEYIEAGGAQMRGVA